MTAVMRRGGTADGPTAIAGEIRRMADALVDLPGVVAAWVHGPAIEGGRYSRDDLQVLVVRRTRGNRVDRALRLAAELGLRVPLDLVVVTPAELRRGDRRVRRAVRRGRRIL